MHLRRSPPIAVGSDTRSLDECDESGMAPLDASRMLGVLLFAAGLNVRGDYLRALLRRRTALALGFLSSLVVPVVMVIVVAPLLNFWHSPAEACDVVLGLAEAHHLSCFWR